MKHRRLSLTDQFFAFSLLFYLSACGAAPTFETQYAMVGDDINNVPSGTVFTALGKKQEALSGRVSIDGSSLIFKGNYVSDTEIELTFDGKTVPLVYDIDQKGFVGRLDKQWVQGNPNSVETTNVSLFFSDLNPYAKRVQFTISEGFNGSTLLKDRVTGIVGFLTDPQALPTSSTYTGVSEISVRSTVGGDSATGQVVLNADFAAGTIDGSMSFTDPLGDATSLAPVDLGTFTVGMPSGTIDGNKFSANLSVYGTSGLLKGSFYGPAGEHAAGIALLGNYQNGNNTLITVTADR